MGLFLVTAPTAEPVTLAQVKLHLRVDDSVEDALLTGLIRAAREHVETVTQRALMTQTWDLKLDAFPCDGAAIEIPKPPTQSVTSITYVDTAGVTQTWSSALYTTDLPSDPQGQPGRIVPAYQQVYPQTRDVPNAVTVRFVAGYTAIGLVPDSIKAAMKILIGTWFDPGRASVALGVTATPIPHTVDALLWPYKAF